jgi:O-antigen/teichoic acid export membrane protein
VAAIPAYVLLLPATVFLTNLTIEVFFYYQLGRPEIPTLVVAGTAILGLPVYYLFTLRWGYLGTAFAFSLIAALRAGGMLIAYRQLSKQSFREILFIKRTEIKRGLHVINKTLPAIWHV